MQKSLDLTNMEKLDYFLSEIQSYYYRVFVQRFSRKLVELKQNDNF